MYLQHLEKTKTLDLYKLNTDLNIFSFKLSESWIKHLCAPVSGAEIQQNKLHHLNLIPVLLVQHWTLEHNTHYRLPTPIDKL